MNANLASSMDTAAAAVLAFAGTPVEYCPRGADSVPTFADIGELADDITQQRHGHDRRRLADFLVSRSVCPNPKNGEQFRVASPHEHAGTWTILGPERRDAITILVRAELRERLDAAAPGAKEVRR
jgi:hypothetical protein